MLTGKCSLVKGVTKQPLLLLSSMRSREKQATPRFLRAAGLEARQVFYHVFTFLRFVLRNDSLYNALI